MKPAKLPSSFRSYAHACAGTQPSNAIGLTDDRWTVVKKVCDRAERLSDNGKLTGKTTDEICEQLYGSSLIWFLWLLKYRALIWQIIRLLAELAHSNRQEQRWGNRTPSE